MDAKTVAGEVATVDEAIIRAMPFVSVMAGIVPGGQVAVPWLPLVTGILTAVDNAAKAVAAGNTSAALDAVVNEIKNHLNPSMPNSPALSPSANGG